MSVGRLFYQVLFLLTVIRLAEVLKFPHRIAIFNSFSPFGCPNTFTIIRNNFFFPPPPDGRNFLCGGRMVFSGTTHFVFLANLQIKNQDIYSTSGFLPRFHGKWAVNGYNLNFWSCLHIHKVHDFSTYPLDLYLERRRSISLLSNCFV